MEHLNTQSYGSFFIKNKAASSWNFLQNKSVFCNLKKLIFSIFATNFVKIAWKLKKFWKGVGDENTKKHFFFKQVHERYNEYKHI